MLRLDLTSIFIPATNFNSESIINNLYLEIMAGA